VIANPDPMARRGVVDFQGSSVEVSLALVPTAVEGTWVLVHAGFALQVVEEDEVRAIWEWVREGEEPHFGQP